MAAARRIHSGAGGDDDSALFDAMGIPESARARLREQSVEGVWPENWQPVQTYLAMQTQWRIGMAGPTGLDYGVLPQVMRWQGVADADQADVWQAVMVMEMEALAIMRSRAA